jgi:PPOX class probable F420-dependent enzyme
MTVALSSDQEDLLRRMRNGTLATAGANGGPHLGPVWYLWDGTSVRISTPAWTIKVADVEADNRVAFCVDDQVSGEYLTIYGTATVVRGDRVSELTMPLLLKYHHPDEAAARWERINADGSRVVMVITPARTAGRQHVR